MDVVHVYTVYSYSACIVGKLKIPSTAGDETNGRKIRPIISTTKLGVCAICAPAPSANTRTIHHLCNNIRGIDYLQCDGYTIPDQVADRWRSGANAESLLDALEHHWRSRRCTVGLKGGARLAKKGFFWTMNYSIFRCGWEKSERGGVPTLQFLSSWWYGNIRLVPHVPVAVHDLLLQLLFRRVFVICQIMLGWKTYKYYYMKPTNFATQGQANPRKKKLKKAKIVLLTTFFLIFRGLGCGVGLDGVRWFPYTIYASKSYAFQPNPAQHN